MSTQALTQLSTGAVTAAFGINTHFKDSGAYEKGGNADPNALTVVGALGASVFRERINDLAPQHQALDALTGMKLYGQAGIDVNDNETTCRNLIHAIATSTRKSRYIAVTGANEPNDRSGSSQTWKDAGGEGITWAQQVVRQQYWIWDQVQIEIAAGNWGTTPGTNRPYVVGPGIKHEHVPLDTDLASLAAATYTTAGVAYHMADLCDAGDMHFYAAANGPGFRMNGKDDNHVVPAGVVLSSIDGKCSQEHFEVQRFRQPYDLKLSGGSGGMVSGHWKYTGGSATTGHGAAFPMVHSEGGFPHTPDSWLDLGALYGPESVLRDIKLGVLWSIIYQALDDAKTDPDLSVYRISTFPSGAYPIYTALHAMASYTGSETFSTVGHFKDISGHLPDCTAYVMSAGSGHYWIYLLREADTEVALSLDAAYTVEGGSLSGDGAYHVKMADSLTIVHVMPTGAGGGVPVWTAYGVSSRTAGTSYADTMTATGATSYAITPGYSVPPGGTFNTATGALTGTSSSTQGPYVTRFRAINGSGHIDTPEIAFNLIKPLAFGTISPPNPVVGQLYEYQIPFNSDAYPPATIARSAGTFPVGITVSADGLISGTAVSAGASSGLRVSATQVGIFSGAASAPFTITVNSSGGGGGGATVPVFTDINAPDGQKGVKYGPDTDDDGQGDGFRFRATGGSDDPTFSVGSGTLPVNLVLSNSGNLRGKPTVVEDAVFTVLATNSAGSTESDPITVSIVDNDQHGATSSITWRLGDPNAPGPNTAISWYGQVWESFIADRKSARFFQLEDINKNPILIGRMKQSGKIDVDDANGDSLAKGDNFNIKVGSDPTCRARNSLVVSWDGTNTTAIYRVYGDAESTSYDDILVCGPTPSAEPYGLSIGNKSGEIYYTGDTVSTRSSATEIAPMNPDGSGGGGSGALGWLCSFSGGLTPTSALVHSCFTPSLASGHSVNLAVATTPELTSPAVMGAQAMDSDGIARHSVGGLAADTRYYARAIDSVSGAYVGETVSFKTRPSGGTKWTRDIAIVSCMSNPGGGSTPQIAWADLLAQNVDEIWHQGDWGYWGQDTQASDSYTKDLDKYRKAQVVLSAMRAAMQANGLGAVTISDHELHVNGDAWSKDAGLDGDTDGAHNCGHSVREMTAFEKLFPIRGLADTRTPRRHRGYSFDIGTEVRVIVTDFRTPDRSNADDADSSAKQMWGAVQTAWVKATMSTGMVNVIVSETSWWHNSGALRATDKPAAYPSAQQDFVDFINATGPYTGGDSYQVAWAGGDRHYVGYCSGDTNTFGGFPQWISSGMFKNALALQVGELMDWTTFTPNNTNDKFNVAQYGILTLASDGAGTISATFRGRVGRTLRQVIDGHATKNSATITSATAAFTTSDIGMLIAGTGLSSDPQTTTITAVAPDGLSATISPVATANTSVGAWTIQNNPATWVMDDAPSGTPPTDEWTVTGGGGGGGLMAPDWLEA